jgi:hypothetical protein
VCAHGATYWPRLFTGVPVEVSSASRYFFTVFFEILRPDAIFF